MCTYVHNHYSSDNNLFYFVLWRCVIIHYEHVHGIPEGWRHIIFSYSPRPFTKMSGCLLVKLRCHRISYMHIYVVSSLTTSTTNGMLKLRGTWENHNDHRRSLLWIQSNAISNGFRRTSNLCKTLAIPPPRESVASGVVLI